jgi:hypothetical protein
MGARRVCWLSTIEGRTRPVSAREFGFDLGAISLTETS